jgi:hypothetical protein
MGNIPPSIGRVPPATQAKIQDVHGNVMDNMVYSNGSAPTEMIAGKWADVFGSV